MQRQAWNEQIAASIAAQRERAQSLLREERQRVRSVESQLLETVQALAVEIAAIEVSNGQRDAELQRRAEALCEESLRIEDQLAALRRGGAGAGATEYDHRRQSAPMPSPALADLESQLDELRESEADLRRQMADSHRQVDLYREALVHLREEQAGKRFGDCPETPADQENSELKAERLVLLDRIESLEAERDELLARSGASDELADMQRRFELAVQELRELKTRNSELSEMLAKLPTAVPTNAGFNWEARKSRMIAELESEGQSSGGDSESHRLSLEGTIRITDQVIAEKDREIAKLTAKVEQLERQKAKAAESAPAVDADEQVRVERERLKRLQDECRDKQRQIEIELSLERAKLARERRQIEQQLHEARSDLETAQEGVSRSTHDKGASSSGRWFARLGLARDDE